MLFIPLPLRERLLTNPGLEALAFQNNTLALMLLNSLSEQLLGQPLPPASELVSAIEADFTALVNLLLTA